MTTIVSKVTEISETTQGIQAPDGWFTADEVHDAYKKGEKDGIEKGKKHYVDQNTKTLTYNLPLSANKAELLIKSLKEKLDISVPIAYLRIDGIAKFSVLILIEKKDFLSDKMREAYAISQQIEEEENQPFEISFSFAMNADNISNDVIDADGYKLKHVSAKTA